MSQQSNSAVDSSQLRRLVDRLLRLNEEKKDLAHTIKEVYNEVNALGYDRHVVQEMVKLLSLEPDARAAKEEKSTLLELYLQALEN